MSLSVTYKNLSSFSPVYFKDPDDKLDFINEDNFTLEGVNLLTYNINKSANDSFLKNYTVNNLIRNSNSTNFVNFKKNIGITDLNTKLNFSSTQEDLSAIKFLKVLTSQDDVDSQVGFSLDILSEVNGDKFFVDFIDFKFCTISFVDGKIPKFLYDRQADSLIFKFLNRNTLPLTGNYYFNYFYDSKNQKLRLFKDNKIVTTTTDILTTNIEVISTNYLGEDEIVTTILSAELPTIGLKESNEDNIKNGTITTNRELKLLNSDNIDQLVYYDYADNFKLSNDTISGINYDFLTFYTYSNILTGNKNYADLKFINLKNHISNSNITYAGSLENVDTDKEYRGREYHNFTNQKSSEKDFDNISLNYTFFDKEFKIGPNDYMVLTMPDNLFPFKKININDTHLAKDGSFAGTNPYFSDKIFKLTDSNRNSLQKSFIDDEEFLVNQNDVSLFLLQNNQILGFQTLNEVTKNDIFGDYLCTWLKGDGINTGTWFDRYYIPNENSYTVPFSGGINKFQDSSQAAEYFKTNKTTDIYYDLKSNMTFEPSGSYVYQRVNQKQINSYIDSQKDKLITDTFNIQTSAVQVQNKDSIILESNKGFDKIDIESIPNKDFNLGFELELDSLSSLNSYQLFGNLYEDGFSIKNNFYFTPFVFIPQDNKVFIYDNNFKLLKTNTYESTSNILDILYLEQNNNIVLVCDNKLIKTNYFGEILDERYPNDVLLGESDLILEIIKSYQSKTYFGYNNVYFITNQYVTQNKIISLDLNNLVPTEVVDLQNQWLQDPLSASIQGISPLSGTSGKEYRYITGREPLVINDSVTCALQNIDRFISKQFIPGFAFLATSLQEELSAGIAQGQSFDSNYFSIIQSITGSLVTSDDLKFFDFIQDGRARVVFDDKNIIASEDPIVDSINTQINDINAANGRLFIQYHNLSAGEGVIQEFTSERFKLSAFNVSKKINEGYKIDFIEENKELKMLSFAKDLSSNIFVDKFNANTGVLEKTYNLPITGIDTKIQTVYIANQEIPVTTFGTNPLTATYPTGLYKYRRFNKTEYDIIIGEGIAGIGTSKFDTLTGNKRHFNPINFYPIDQKYKKIKDKLAFKFNLNTLIGIKELTEQWDRAGPPVSAYGYVAFDWAHPAENLSGWDGEFATITSAGSANNANYEIIFTVPNLSIKNYINVNFELNLGKISVYNNGIVIGVIEFNPNAIPIQRIIYPELYINTQNIRNIPIDKIVKDISYNSTGGTLKNFKIHNTSFDQNLVNYLELQTKPIDPLYFRLPSSTRNESEEIDTLFTYNIPGNVSNYIKVNIKDININNSIKEQLEEYLTSTVKVVTPSQQKLIYNID